jgi:nitrogen fixation protein FixH
MNATASPLRTFRWPAIVLGLLAAHVLLMAWAVMKATGDRSAIVIPDYYVKSLHWDQDKAELARSAALGWTVKLTPAGTADSVGLVPVLITLNDKSGAPLSADSLELTYCHQAHADRVLTARLQPESATTPNGRYLQALSLPQPGFYSFSVVAIRGTDRFTVQWTQHISPHAEEMP